MLMHAAKGFNYYMFIMKSNCSFFARIALHTLLANALDARLRNITCRDDTAETRLNSDAYFQD